MEITLEKIRKDFGTVVAVRDVSLTFDSGKLVALLGPSGCGKTTILNLISGILPVTSGRILFDNKDVTNLTPDKRGVGLVFQNYALYPHMTVLENISFPLMVKKVPKKERKEIAEKFAELVRVKDLLARKPGQLSGGQQQRVAIARALSKEPSILLLDEPLSNLDARLRIEMREEIRRVQKDTGITTVFVTHDQEEAASISDKVALLQLGEVHQYASPRELYDNPVDLFTAGFIGTPTINHLSGIIRDGLFYTNNKNIRIPNKGNAPEGRDLVLAFRAEGLRPVKENEDFTAIVDEVYIMGRDNLAHFNHEGGEFRAFIEESSGIEAGKEVKLSFKDKGVFLFDKETGERYA
ncbi:MAG: ABC transporter ATP-binding protein [Treponema sp.]|nr:ABC transporter ATP-binding protein [Treponema sp.]